MIGIAGELVQPQHRRTEGTKLREHLVESKSMMKPSVGVLASGSPHDVGAPVPPGLVRLFVERLRSIEVLGNGVQKLLGMVAKVLLGERRIGRQKGSCECRELVDDLVVIVLDEGAQRCGVPGCGHG